MAELIGSILILLGAVLHFGAGLGLLRMPDAYTRMQAATKAPTLGNALVLGGGGLLSPGLDTETADSDLFRAHDGSGVVARARARGLPNRNSDGSADESPC